jgi:hypothetical protein
MFNGMKHDEEKCTQCAGGNACFGATVASLEAENARLREHNETMKAQLTDNVAALELGRQLNRENARLREALEGSNRVFKAWRDRSCSNDGDCQSCDAHHAFFENEYVLKRER